MTAEEYIKNNFGNKWVITEWLPDDVIDALEEHGNNQWNAALTAVQEEVDKTSLPAKTKEIVQQMCEMIKI